MKTTVTSNTLSFLAGGGEMGTLTRQHNWSKTALGTPGQWPQSLKTTVGLILHSAFPMFLFWGDDLLCFYNDAYRPSLGTNGKHPTALGKPGKAVWPEIWDFIGPLIDQVLATGEAVWFEDQLVPIYRNGRLEDVYWTFSYSPAFGDDGQINGVLVTCTETTEVVNTVSELRASEQRFQNLLREAPVAMALFRGPQFVIELANEEVLVYWGRRREQVMNKPLFEALPEASGQGFEELLTGVYATGERFVARELPVTLERNGRLEQTYIDFVYEPYRETDGTISGITVVCVEITEQVLARQRIEESERRFRTLVQESPVATCLFVGWELVIDIANELMIRFFGRGPSIVGKPVREVLTNTDGDALAIALLTQVFTTGIPFSAQAAPAELTIDGVAGTYYFDLSLKPLRSAEGDVYAVLETATNVTDQALARQKVEAVQVNLLLANQHLSLALEAGQLGSYNLELATGLMSCTPQCKANYGQPPDAPFNFPDLMRVILPDDRVLVQRAVDRAIATRTTYHAEYRICWPDTTLHWIKASGQPTYAADGQPLRIIGVTQDITTQRMAQAELERQVDQRTQQLQISVQDLQRSNDNLQKFAYVASHDLQEPLRKIQQFGDLLKTQYAEPLGDGVDYLKRMQSAAGRMSALIRDLLSFSRIATQRDSSAPVSLTSVVGTVLADLDLIIAESRAVVEVDALPTISGDTSQLGQLFQNLLSNALKFRRPDRIGAVPVTPHVRVTCRTVVAADLPPSAKPTLAAQTYYQIDVADNGIGFDPKYIDRIFQVFQRLHSKGEFAGTGIGLAICEKVVTNHGGAITATSQPGQGATFSVYLPQ